MKMIINSPQIVNEIWQEKNFFHIILGPPQHCLAVRRTISFLNEAPDLGWRRLCRVSPERIGVKERPTKSPFTPIWTAKNTAAPLATQRFVDSSLREGRKATPPFRTKALLRFCFKALLEHAARSLARARIVRRHRGIFPPAEFRHLKLAAAAPNRLFVSSEPKNGEYKIPSLSTFLEIAGKRTLFKPNNICRKDRAEYEFPILRLNLAFSSPLTTHDGFGLPVLWVAACSCSIILRQSGRPACRPAEE